MVLANGKSFCEKLHDVSPCNELYDSDLRKDINKVASIFGFNKYVVSPIETPISNGLYTTYTIKLSKDENEDDSILIMICRGDDESKRSIYLNGDFDGAGFEFELSYNREWRRRAYSINVNKDILYVRVESVGRDRVKCNLSRKKENGFLEDVNPSQTSTIDFNSVLDWLKKFIESPKEKYSDLKNAGSDFEKVIRKA